MFWRCLITVYHARLCDDMLYLLCNNDAIMMLFLCALWYLNFSVFAACLGNSILCKILLPHVLVTTTFSTESSSGLLSETIVVAETIKGYHDLNFYKEKPWTFALFRQWQVQTLEVSGDWPQAFATLMAWSYFLSICLQYVFITVCSLWLPLSSCWFR